MNYRLDTVLLMTWLLILAIGTVMVASASIVKGDGFLYRHVLFLTLALMRISDRSDHAAENLGAGQSNGADGFAAGLCSGAGRRC